MVRDVGGTGEDAGDGPTVKQDDNLLTLMKLPANINLRIKCTRI